MGETSSINYNMLSSESFSSITITCGDQTTPSDGKDKFGESSGPGTIVERDLRPNYTFTLLCLSIAILYADQNIMAPNLSAIAKEFHMTNQERDVYLGAHISLGFFIIGGFVSVLVGYLADISHRNLLYGYTIMLGETFCLITFFTTNYTQLFVCRIFSGISIGAANPIIFTLISDLYPKHKRSASIATVGAAISFGVGAGQFISGMISPYYGWRMPFLLLSLPGLMLCFLIITTTVEPKVGQQDVLEQQRALLASRTGIAKNSTVTTIDSATEIEAERISTIAPVHYVEKISLKKVRKLFLTKSILLVYLQGIPGCLPWGLTFTYLNDYYSSDKGLSVQSATLAMTLFLFSGILGQFAGGFVGQELHKRDCRYPSIFMAAVTTFTILPYSYLINVKLDHRSSSKVGFFLVSGITGFLSSMTGPIIRNLLSNVTLPEIRGTAFSIFNLTNDLGMGLGPFLCVIIITALGNERQLSFNIILLFWVICSLVIVMTFFTVKHDEEEVNRKIRTVISNGSILASRNEGGDCADVCKEADDSTHNPFAANRYQEVAV